MSKFLCNIIGHKVHHTPGNKSDYCSRCNEFQPYISPSIKYEKLSPEEKLLYVKWYGQVVEALNKATGKNAEEDTQLEREL